MRGKLSKELDRILKKIKIIEKQRPSHKEILEFVKHIIKEQYKIKPLIKTEPIEMTKEIAIHQLAGGFPLLDKKELKIDMKMATTLFKNICKSLREKNKTLAPWMRIISKAIRSKELDMEDIFKRYIEGDSSTISSLCEKIGVNGGLFRMIVENSLKPFFEAYAQKIKGLVEQDRWVNNICPVCGSEPVIGMMKDFPEKGMEGGRFLVCSLCGFDWWYKRLACPYCGIEKGEKVRHFTTPSEGKAFRVEVCDECKRYIKTIDTKIYGNEIVPLIEDIATLHLDIIAEKEGYKRGIPGLLEIERCGSA